MTVLLAVNPTKRFSRCERHRKGQRALGLSGEVPGWNRRRDQLPPMGGDLRSPPMANLLSGLQVLRRWAPNPEKPSSPGRDPSGPFDEGLEEFFRGKIHHPSAFGMPLDSENKGL